MSQSGTTPLVSVIMPAYNARDTIFVAIASVLDQSERNLELIVINDASTDDTAAIVRSFGDPRVRLIETNRNLRSAAARNLGLEAAGGKWFAALDADDMWEKNRLRRLIGVAEHGFFLTDFCLPSVPDRDGTLVPIGRPEGNNPTATVEEIPDYAAFLGLKIGMLPLFPLGHVRKHGLKFPESGSGGEWAFFIARAFSTGLKCKLLRLPGYLYRVTGAHDSSTLRAIEEQLKMDLDLASASWVPDNARQIIADRILPIRRRLLVAALRERNWRKFALYAARHPGDLIYLPESVMKFAVRKLMLNTRR